MTDRQSHVPMIQPASPNALSHIGFWECGAGEILLAQDSGARGALAMAMRCGSNGRHRRYGI
jgi:hypothetical protein